jgi:hypothetical protein
MSHKIPVDIIEKRTPEKSQKQNAWSFENLFARLFE